MKRFLSLLLVTLSTYAWSQDIYDWMDTAPDGNWRQGASGARWSGTGCGGGVCWDEPPYGILRFNNNHQLSMTNNVAGTYSQYRILFGASNTSARTINGGTIQFLDFSGNNPLIQNSSTGHHVINTNLIVGSGGTWNMDVMATSGSLTFGGTWSNDNSKFMYLQGDNSAVSTDKSLNMNGVISGNGEVRLINHAFVTYGAAHTYSGQTLVSKGELVINNGGDIMSSIINIGEASAPSDVTKFFLNGNDGQNFTRSITIAQGDDDTRYIGSLNSSGVTTLSGAITKHSGTNLYIEVVAPNGIFEISGGMGAASNGHTVKVGEGTLRVVSQPLNGAAGNTFFINEGTVEVDAFPGNLLATSGRPMQLGADGLGILRVNSMNTSYSGDITIDSNNGEIQFNSSNSQSFSGVLAFGANTLTINNQSSNNVTLSADQTGTGILNITSTGSGAVILTRASYSRTGNTVVNQGELRLNPGAAATFNSKIVLNGGTLSTTGIVSGRTFTSSATLEMSASSSIDLGSNGHTLTFANSSAETWTGSLTINGWSGAPTTSGTATAGRIFIGSDASGLTTTQLAQITFDGYAGGAVIDANGELFPEDYLTYYSTGSVAPNSLANWNSETDGTGTTPTDFTSTLKFVIQNGQTMTTSADWTLTGEYAVLQIQSGGILQADHAITIPTTGTFEIQDGGTYIHNNTTTYSSSILRSGATITLAPTSTFEIRKSNSTLPLLSSYGNLTINCDEFSTTNASNFGGNLTSITGNFSVLNTNAQQLRLANAGTTLTVGGDFILNGSTAHFVLKNNTTTGDQTMIVNGNVQLLSGTFAFTNDASGGRGILRLRGSGVTISNDLTFSANLVDGSGFYLDRNVAQTLTIGHAFTSGDWRNRFYIADAGEVVNEVYNGTVAQETISGTSGTPIAGYSAWPTSGTALSGITINNSSATGVTLRNDRRVNGTLTLTDGLFNTGDCNSGTTSTTLLTLADGATMSGASAASYVNGVMRKIGNDAFTFPVGSATDYAPVSMSAPANATDEFGACYASGSAIALGDAYGTGIDHVSDCEYWHINRTVGASDVSVTLTWDSRSCGVDDLGQLRVARWTGALWENVGNAGTTGDTDAGTITSGSVSSFSPFTLASADASNPLPVTLTSFTARCSESEVQLHWVTASEYNASHFVVQSSKDATVWTTLGEVKAAGTTSATTQYRYAAPNQGVFTYYRLVQVDFDGAYEIFGPIYSNCDLNGSSMLITPNPATELFTLILQSTERIENATVVITDLSGRVMWSKRVDIEQGANTILCEINGMQPGVYVARVQHLEKEFPPVRWVKQ